MDLYHENKIDTYKLEEDTPNSNVYYAKDNIGVDITKPIKSRTHIFGKPPVKVLSANMDRKSLLDDIKSLQDAYNNVISDLVNEVSDFRQALMRVVGAVFEAEDISKMIESGVIQLPPNSEVDYLIKNINDTFVQNLLNSLEEKIYKVSNHIDTNEKLVSNISGVTLRSRLIALESKCSLIQNMMEDLIKNRLKCYFYYLKQTSNALYNYKDIKVKFTANIPADLTGLADVCVKLIPLVSQETLLSLLPFIENPDVELQKFNNEQESKMINLDYVEDGDINEPTTE
jgi:SPP1 family phage portal protein